MKDNFWYTKFCRNFNDALVELLTYETPLSEEWFLRRISYIFKYKTVSPKIRTIFDCYKNQARSKGVIFSNGFMTLTNGKPIEFRVSNPINLRKFEYVSCEELSKGLLKLIKINIKAEKEGIYGLLLKELEVLRITDSVFKRLDEALKLIRNNVEVDGNFLVYKKDN